MSCRHEPAARRLAGTLGRLLALGLLGLALAGCAGNRQWSSVIADEAPPVGEDDQAVWAESRDEWRAPETAFGKAELLGPADVPVEAWTFEKASLALRLKAGDRLNEFRGSPHTLLVHVYQVADPNGLQAYFDGGSGLRQLLTAQEQDPSVLALQRVIVQPGSNRLLQLDRAMMARYLVIVAGYTGLDVVSSTRVVPIPGVRDYPGGMDGFLDALNPWAALPPARPARLQLWVVLGQDKIEKLEVRAR